MKVEVRRTRQKGEKSVFRVLIDDSEEKMYSDSLSNALTQCIACTSRGIFSSGNITFHRDGERKVMVNMPGWDVLSIHTAEDMMKVLSARKAIVDRAFEKQYPEVEESVVWDW